MHRFASGHNHYDPVAHSQGSDSEQDLTLSEGMAFTERPSQSRTSTPSTSSPLQGMPYPPQQPIRGESSSSPQQFPVTPGYAEYNIPLEPSQTVNSSGSSNPYKPDSESSPGFPRPTHRPTGSSWDFLSSPMKKFEAGYEEFDSRNASEAHLAFAQGDMPENKFSKFYNYLLNVSIFTRWFLFIVPVLTLLWIPGILQLTSFPNAQVYDVKLLWWSIWLSVLWGGWWCSLASARLLPVILRVTFGVVAVGFRKYIDWAAALNRYIALFSWTLALWISWNPLIDNRQPSDASSRSAEVIDFLGKLLFAIFLCAAVLLFEKFSIQWIAGKFHERSYAERIADQKFAVRSLVILYRNSSDIPGRTDTLRGTHTKDNATPQRFFRQAMKGVRMAATTTTTVFGNVASEIAGTSVLQPNSPPSMVKTALESANKSRLLARRLFFSFVKPGHDHIFLEDIARFFQTREEAEHVYGLFDRDSNGDASLEEVELACMDFHREQLSLEHSMQDLDSAVGRLDNIFMSLYVVIAALIIAVALEAEVATLVTSAGTLVLGLSWLIGSSLAEVLTSIIFLFIKHPFDVGDRIDLDKASYTVKEIRLLSTIFLDSKGVYVQAPNTALNAMFIQNIRRSPQMSETFTFDVGFGTSFEDLERLRKNMISFLENNTRDYLPTFDVSVVDFPEQEKMTLTADIKYKSNAQQGGIKAKRRNKWICALKNALAEVGIYGPKGNPDAIPPPSRYIEVPWEEAQAAEARSKEQHDQLKRRNSHMPAGGWQLRDKNTALIDDADNIFGEQEEVAMPVPVRGLSSNRVVPRTPPMPRVVPTSPFESSEVIEMSARDNPA